MLGTILDYVNVRGLLVVVALGASCACESAAQRSDSAHSSNAKIDAAAAKAEQPDASKADTANGPDSAAAREPEQPPRRDSGSTASDSAAAARGSVDAAAEDSEVNETTDAAAAHGNAATLNTAVFVDGAVASDTVGGPENRGDAGQGPANPKSIPAPSGALDVYANVVAITVSGTPGGFTFAVSIESADIDCDQFADWWEVISENGELIYRRILTHSHTDENGTTDADAPGNRFTRDGGPVEISNTDVVLVRAHMNNAGYIGAVFRGSVSGGFTATSAIDADFASNLEDLAHSRQIHV